eukprot:CAMPEP_0182890326 /NCGR_PEP_ID=MMETSP0034_2-20130328/22591_1 /TAXON_ID=156128 /ORGANISM="Nephroselmis pyriformis, Strain CCMP717" /LENGTH=64 /DNA_ID=CAMNT_0025023867 /DNA_START=153 /DNA_END=345 /DNA_ORIENTATION=+
MGAPEGDPARSQQGGRCSRVCKLMNQQRDDHDVLTATSAATTATMNRHILEERLWMSMLVSSLW